MRRVPSHLPLVLSLGMVSQIGQVVVLRELLMVFHGNELSFGIILGAWMVWVGVGSHVGSRISARAKKSDDRSLLHVVAASVLIMLPLTVVAIRGLRSLFAVQPGAYLSLVDMLVSTFIVLAPVGLLLGMLFVLLSRAWRLRDHANDTSGASKTYIGEAAGHALGGILFTLVLVQLLSSIHVAVLSGIVLAAAGVVAGMPSSSREPTTSAGVSRTSRIMLWSILAIAVFSLPFLERVNAGAYELQWRSFSPEHELISVHQSRYGTVSVAHRAGQYSFFQSGNLLFSAAARNPTRTQYEEHQAVEAAHFWMVQHPNPRRVLLIGGGMRGTLREILRHPVERVDYVELDPVVTEVAGRYVAEDTIAALDREEVQLLHGDGRVFLGSGSEGDERREYDLIVVDGPEPVTAALNRYYTQEFFRKAAARLDSEGVFVIGAASTPDLQNLPILNRNATIYHTLKQVFPEVLPVGGRHLHYFAGTEPGLVSADPEVLQRRYFERQLETPGFSPRQFELLLEEGPLRRVNWAIRTHGRSHNAHLVRPEAPPMRPESISEQQRMEDELEAVNERYFVNSDLRPIGYIHSLAFWSRLTRADHAHVFDWMLRVRPWWFVPVIAVALLVPLGLRLFGGDGGRAAAGRYAVLFAVFTTGLSTMALEVALLFSFQNLYGFVYEMIGLIVAAFMAGLAIGTAGTYRYVTNKADIGLLRTVQITIAGFAGLIALLLPRVATIESPQMLLLLFFVVTFFAGALNGVDFPLAAACSHAYHRRAEKATGLVYGTELFGACAGAIVAGVLVAPVLGLVACCLLAAIGNATSYGVLRIAGRSYEVPKAF